MNMALSNMPDHAKPISFAPSSSALRNYTLLRRAGDYQRYGRHRHCANSVWEIYWGVSVERDVQGTGRGKGTGTVCAKHPSGHCVANGTSPHQCSALADKSAEGGWHPADKDDVCFAITS